MESREISAKTVEEAIEIALKELGVGREEAEVEVLSKGRTGILGWGGEPARVRVRVRPRGESQEQATLAVQSLEKLLRAMNIQATVVLKEQSATPGNPVALDIRGQDLGILIGRRGETLAALQFLVSLMVSRQVKARTRISVDVDGYRQRRQDSLRSLAMRLAEQVKSSGQPVTLEPMPARERRIIHLSLASHPTVTTASVGEGDGRRVTIVPRRHGAQQ